MKSEPDWDSEHLAMKAKVAAERSIPPVKDRKPTPDDELTLDDELDDLIDLVFKK
jgi:hypothetical protein